jgi:hypothetical protein
MIDPLDLLQEFEGMDIVGFAKGGRTYSEDLWTPLIY